MSCGRPDCHIWEDHGHFDTTGDTNPPKQDWAEERAREWLAVQFGGLSSMSQPLVAPLARLLREVALSGPQHDVATILSAAEARDKAAAAMCAVARRDTLAEVRRVVEDECPPEDDIQDEYERAAHKTCKAILSRLDNLTPSKSKDNL